MKNIYKVNEEAVKKIAERVYDNGSTVINRNDLEEMFPELKESEDEKIRKWIIAYLENRVMNTSITDEKDNCLDAIRWLKKQGEQKPSYTTDLRTWKYIVDAVLTEREGIGQYIDSPWTTEVAEKLQKRFGSIEQKPVDTHNVCDTCDEQAGCVNPCPMKLVEQKSNNWIQELENKLANATHKQLAEWKEKYFKEEPAWSEDAELSCFESALFSAFSYAWQEYLSGKEVNIAKWAREHSAELLEAAREQKPAEWRYIDENRINNICDFIQGHTNFADSAKKAAVVFLKSLKERVQPQQKQEWGEEDEEMYKEVLTDIIYAKNDLKAKECHGLSKRAMEAFNWFSKRYKSLRPQNTWKPSDEMLEALYRVIPENVMEKSEDEMLLDKLYQGLKYGRVLSEN